MIFVAFFEFALPSFQAITDCFKTETDMTP
jgi:hypothetical protein